MISFLANPLRFLRFARYAIPVFGILAVLFIGFGVWFGLWDSPPDQLQGESVRVMYVHVPAAWISMLAYAVMAVSSFIYYIWRHPIADELAKACALPGMMFTGLALITGALWGKSSWGTYWQWDGRMTSYLLLLFLYIGYISIRASLEDKARAARISGLVAMVGAINLPIIKFSVDWWSSLHQTSTISAIDAPGLPGAMMTPLMLMFLGYSFLFGWLILSRVEISIAQAKQSRSKKPQYSAAKIEVETL